MNQNGIKKGKKSISALLFMIRPERVVVACPVSSSSPVTARIISLELSYEPPDARTSFSFSSSLSTLFTESQ